MVSAPPIKMVRLNLYLPKNKVRKQNNKDGIINLNKRSQCCVFGFDRSSNKPISSYKVRCSRRDQSKIHFDEIFVFCIFSRASKTVFRSIPFPNTP